jgi:exopolysaccharide biosynthesis protein
MRIRFFTNRITSFKPGFAGHIISVFLLCVLCGLCVKTNAQTFTQLHPGVEYAQVEHKLGSDPVKINLLRLDLTKVRLDVHHALDKAIGLETTSSIAIRKNAVAAINAGFFRLDKSEFAGDAAGILQIDGDLLSEVLNPRTAILISNEYAPIEVADTNLNRTKGQKYFAKLDSTSVLFEHLETESRITVNKTSFPVGGMNREKKSDEIVIYTPTFGRATPTNVEGLEIRVRRGKVIDFATNSGGTQIPADGFVISVSGSLRDSLQPLIKRKQKVAFERRALRTIHNGVTSWKSDVQVEDITNGVPQLIKNGKIDITWEQEKASRAFVETRHPRTAVAKLKDGKFLMMTVDGRQPGVSVGMSLQELAEYLFSLGAVDAMNLDGGGSTTMYLDGKVVNTPSDKEGERKIGDAIVVTLRKQK